MRDYLKPRRRQCGVIVLGMTCLFAAGWVRSFTTKDEFEFADRMPFAAEVNDGQLSGLISDKQSLALQKYRFELDKHGRSSWVTIEYAPVFVIPYWAIVIPLTLLSAWLLNCKPRQSKPTSNTPPS